MLPLENLTVSQFLRRSARRFSDRPAVSWQGQVLTYKELDEMADIAARRLLSLGVKKGDHVGIWCEPEPLSLCLVYAVPRIGAVATLLNTSLQQAELRQIIESTDINMLLIGEGYKDLSFPAICHDMKDAAGGVGRHPGEESAEGATAKGACDPAGEAGRGFIGGDTRSSAGKTAALPYSGSPGLRSLPILSIAATGAGGGFPVFTEVPAAAEEALAAAEAEVRPEDTGYILYTSGTAALPKAVLHSQAARVNSAIQQADDLSMTCEDRVCVAMPAFHCFCLAVSIMGPCAVGAMVYIPKSRHTADLLAAVEKGRCTVFSSVPALFHAMLARQDFDKWDLSSLRIGFIGGGMYTPEQFKEIDRRLGMTLLSSLGQTEATAGITAASATDPLEVRASTVGHFMSHVEGRICEPGTGRELPAGEAGEICVRGYVVMQGYYGQPEMTAAAIDRDGWLHTGDMGYLDVDGNVHLTGRLKDLIIRGGENISPAEIEAVAAQIPGARSCRAVGVPDPHYGEEVCLCICPEEGCEIRETEVRRRLAAALAHFKVPKHILLMEEFPRTTTGKIRTAELKKEAARRLGI